MESPFSDSGISIFIHWNSEIEIELHAAHVALYVRTHVMFEMMLIYFAKRKKKLFTMCVQAIYVIFKAYTNRFRYAQFSLSKLESNWLDAIHRDKHWGSEKEIQNKREEKTISTLCVQGNWLHITLVFLGFPFVFDPTHHNTKFIFSAAKWYAYSNDDKQTHHSN